MEDENELKTNLPVWKKEIDLFEVWNGILYRRAPVAKRQRRMKESIQVVLPLSLRDMVLREMLDDPLSDI